MEAGSVSPRAAASVDRAPVLIVEDDTCLRALLGHYLRGEGFPVLEACDGAEAIAVLDRRATGGPRPGLVLLDLMLPGTSGLQVLDWLRARHDDVPVVAISVSDPLLMAAAEMGARAVLVKPFDLEHVLPIVARYCEMTPAGRAG